MSPFAKVLWYPQFYSNLQTMNLPQIYSDILNTTPICKLWLYHRYPLTSSILLQSANYDSTKDILNTTPICKLWIFHRYPLILSILLHSENFDSTTYILWYPQYYSNLQTMTLPQTSSDILNSTPICKLWIFHRYPLISSILLQSANYDSTTDILWHP